MGAVETSLGSVVQRHIDLYLSERSYIQDLSNVFNKSSLLSVVPFERLLLVRVSHLNFISSI